MAISSQRWAAFAVRRKSQVVAYVLWLLLGVLGIHRLYLGMKVTGICMACLALVNVGLLVLGKSGDELLLRSVVVGGAPMLWVLSDVFRISRFVQDYNDQLIRCQRRGEMSHFRQDKMSHFLRVKLSHLGHTRDSHPGGYPVAALPSSSFTWAFNTPALRLLFSL